MTVVLNFREKPVAGRVKSPPQVRGDGANALAGVKHLVLYIHGYNTPSFDGESMGKHWDRLVSPRLGADAPVPLVMLWPGDAGVGPGAAALYPLEYRDADESGRALATWVRNELDADARVDIVAVSLGARVACRYWAELYRHDRQRLRNTVGVLLCAAVDASVLARPVPEANGDPIGVAEAIAEMEAMYVSSSAQDRALGQARRLGDLVAGAAIFDGGPVQPALGLVGPWASAGSTAGTPPPSKVRHYRVDDARRYDHEDFHPPGRAGALPNDKHRTVASYVAQCLLRHSQPEIPLELEDGPRGALSAPPSVGDPVWVDTPSADDTYNILVLGTSISWGQGLLPAQRYPHLVGRRIADALHKKVEITSFAHSGARIWEEPQGGLAKSPLVEHAPETLEELEQLLKGRHTGSRYVRALARDGGDFSGECPGAPAHIWMQLREAQDRLSWPKPALKAPDLVLLDAGANDVGIMNVPSPFAGRGDISSNVMGLKGAITDLLVATRRAFPEALIVCSGYYAVFSEQSRLEHVKLNWFWENIDDQIDDQLIRGWIAKAQDFRSLFNDYLLPTEVAEACRQCSDTRILLSAPTFQPAEAMLAPKSCIWGPDDNGSAMDSALDKRTGERGPCRRHGIAHHRASFGHPNVDGARRYADAAWEVLAPAFPSVPRPLTAGTATSANLTAVS